MLTKTEQPERAVFLTLKSFVQRSPTRMAVIIALLIYGFTVYMVPTALNVNALGTLLMLTLLLSFASAGQTIVMIGGGIDLTVGAVMSSSAVITTVIMDAQDGRVLQVFAVVMALGATVGFINGICTNRIGLPPLIVTLAIGNVVTQMSYLYTGGTPWGWVGPAFVSTVTHRFFGFIPSLTLYALVIIPLVFYILYRSRFGRQLFLVGTSNEAARLCGINVNKVKVISYIISGMFSAFTGMLAVAMWRSSRNQMFDAYAFNSLIAVVVGGTAFSGGIGSYSGTIAGAMLMTMLNNCLTALNISGPVRNVVFGIVLALLLVMYNRKKPVRQ